LRIDEIIGGLRILFAMIGAVAVLTLLAHTADHAERTEARVSAIDPRVERLERRQRELSDRIDALSSSLRATVRPIGWDVPRDGGRR